MSRPVHNPGTWPRLMRAPTAAAYVDERSVDAFLRRVGTVYPHGRNRGSREAVWDREDLDAAVERLKGERRAESLADDL